mgnify:CR=1 FL=1
MTDISVTGNAKVNIIGMDGETHTITSERQEIVEWLRGDDNKIPALAAFAPLVSGNNMPSMSGDNRDRLHPHIRRRYDAVIVSICNAIERGDHRKD